MKRFAIILTAWMTGLAGVLGSVFFPVASASAALPSVVPAAVSAPGGFTSVAPFRLLDTRSGLGAPTGSVAAGGTVVLQVAGQGGVPLTGVSAVVLNVTVAAPTSSGFVTVYGDGTTRPTASNLNFVKDQVVPNLVIAPVGAGGKVDLFNGSPGTADLVADVSGYFLSGVPTASGAFVSLAPSRLLDTRSGLGLAAGAGAVAASGTVALQVAGQGGVPLTGVSAVVLNVTVAEPTSSGFVTVFGDGATRPTASNLNFVKDQVVPNLVVAPVGADGQVDLFNGSPGTAHLVADVSGYFLSGTPTVVGALGSLPPFRLLDTRSGLGAPTGAVAPGGTVVLQVAGQGGVPLTGVSAVVLNVTAAEPTASGYVSVYGDGTTRPTASNLNFVPGQTVPNLVIAPVGAGGKVDLYNGSGGTIQLIGDVSGYYRAGDAPPPLVIATTSLAAGTAGLRYLQPLTATGGTDPYVWAATGLPAGLTLSPDGILAGTPTTTGTTAVGLQVNDGAGARLTRTLSLAVPDSLPGPCLGGACSIVTPDGSTVALAAASVVSIARDATSGAVNQIVINTAPPAVNQILAVEPTPAPRPG